MKTDELAGAELDYWVARAEGIVAEQLTIRRVQRSDEMHVVLEPRTFTEKVCGPRVLRYSTDWKQGGQLVDKHRPHYLPAPHGGWWAAVGRSCFVEGATALQAICRAIVRDRFGDEVTGTPEVTL